MPKIKNFKNLAVSDLRKTALEIAEAGFKAIVTKEVIKKILKEQPTLFERNDIKRIFVVGVGKCVFEAAEILEEILGERLSGGIAISLHSGQLKKIKTYIGDHPFPSQRNIKATKEIIKLLKSLKEDDLVIFIISGGGSTLLCQPPLNMDYQKEAEILNCLFRAGADIRKINTIRKHISLARGGQLAKYIYPAKAVSLIFSDVPGDNLEFIASGPTVKDSTTVADAEKILTKYDIWNKCGIAKSNLIETPKEEKYFANIKNILAVSNKNALEAMGVKAQELGFKTQIKTTSFTGEARDLGKQIIKDFNKISSKTILLYGGESTVIVKSQGKGGRNQELALSALRFIEKNQLIVSIASDGRDNTNFAGAICDIITREKAAKAGLNIEKYLKDNNSYVFFSKTGDYLLTGDTSSNVADLIIAIRN